MNFDDKEISKLGILLNILKWQLRDNYDFEKKHGYDTSYTLDLLNDCISISNKINAGTKENSNET